MDEEVLRLKVDVACQVQIVDFCTFKCRRLLGAYVGGEKEQPVTRIRWRQVAAKAFQAVDDHGDVLVSKVAPLFDQVPERSSMVLPGDDGI